MVKLVGLVVLHLIASSGGTVTANNLREKLRIEAIRCSTTSPTNFTI